MGADLYLVLWETPESTPLDVGSFGCAKMFPRKYYDCNMRPEVALKVLEQWRAFAEENGRWLEYDLAKLQIETWAREFPVCLIGFDDDCTSWHGLESIRGPEMCERLRVVMPRDSECWRTWFS